MGTIRRQSKKKFPHLSGFNYGVIMETVNAVFRIVAATLIGLLVVSAIFALVSVANAANHETATKKAFLEACVGAGAHPGQCLSILISSK